MRKFIFALYALLATAAAAQETNSVFNFLEMPVSAHATALGGRNISLISDDASLVFANPALLSSVTDKTLNLNYMTYLQGCNVGSAAFVKVLGERSTMGVTAQYAHYGSMDETTADNVTVGSFSAMPISSPMMPRSFATLSAVKYGVETNSSRVPRFSAKPSVHSKW